MAPSSPTSSSGSSRCTTPSTIAAVIVEPVAGSTGVLIPPKGYLERLREICDKHGILLIFDEVITGFGRLGTPFAAQRFGVTPDMMTTAKGLTNGAVPMGAVFASDAIYDAFMQGPSTASSSSTATPIRGTRSPAPPPTPTRGCSRAASLEPYWEDAVHSLKGPPHVIDIRNFGLIGAIELEPSAGAPARRAFEAFVKAFESGVLIRVTGDIIALSPPLIVEKPQIDRLFAVHSGGAARPFASTGGMNSALILLAQ